MNDYKISYIDPIFDNSEADVILAHINSQMWGLVKSYDASKGFCVVIKGISLYIPLVKMSKTYISRPEIYIGRHLLFNIDIDDDCYISFSRLIKDKIVKSGSCAQGIVCAIMDNRCFVDIGFSTRILLKDLSDHEVKDIYSKVKIGQEIEVVLLEDYIGQKYTQASTKPSLVWKAKTKNLRINELINVNVLEINKEEGIKFQISPYLTGYARKEDLGKLLTKRLENDEVELYELIEVAVTGFCKEEGLVYVSIKRAQQLKYLKDWETYLADKNINDILTFQIQSIEGEWVCLRLGNEIHTKQPIYALPKCIQERIRNRESLYGEKVETAIVYIDHTKHQFLVNCKQVNEAKCIKAENTLKSKIKVGDELDALVIKVLPKYALIQIERTEVITKIDRKNLSQNKVIQANDAVYPGELIKVSYIGDTENRMCFKRIIQDKLYDDSFYKKDLEELLANMGIKDNLFVGRVVTTPTGLFMFDVVSWSNSNGNSVEGKLLENYLTGQRSIVNVPSPLADSLKEDVYYKFSIKLAPEFVRKGEGNPFMFSVPKTSSMVEVANPYMNEVSRAFSKQCSPAQNPSLAALLREVGLNLYTEKNRMFFELLQNADDAAPIDGVQILVEAVEHGIAFSHNGNAFNFDDFKSITSAAKSTKQIKKKKTGYKGIGFKSVFTHTSSVLIKSGGFKFAFDQDNEIFKNFDDLYIPINILPTEEAKQVFLNKFAEERKSFTGVEDVPWQLMPVWVDETKLKPAYDSFKQSANVVIGLVMDPYARNEYQQAIEEVFNSPRMFLFLRNTKRIQFIRFGQDTPQTIYKHIDTQNNLLELIDSTKPNQSESYRLYTSSFIPLSDSSFLSAGVGITIQKEEVNGVERFYFAELNDGQIGKRIDDIPEKIASSSYTDITIAFKMDDRGTVAADQSGSNTSLYAYLPMNEQRFKFPFYVNADFVLLSNREGLQSDNRWNIFLFHHLGRIVVEAVSSMASVKNPSFLSLFPKFLASNLKSTEKIVQAFNQSYEKALNETPFILDEQGILRKQSDIFIDDSGFVEIVGEKVFCQIMNTTRYRVSKFIYSDRLLDSSLFKSIEIISQENILYQLVNKASLDVLNNWIDETTSELKQEFIDWLQVYPRLRNWINMIKQIHLIPLNGSLQSCNYFAENKVFILSNRVFGVRQILQKLGIVCADEMMEEHPLSEFMPINSDIEVFEKVSTLDLTMLSKDERIELLTSIDKWDKVKQNMYQKLLFVKNRLGSFMKLEDAVMPKSNMPSWYKAYVIDEDEYTPIMDPFIPSTSQINFNFAFKLFQQGYFKTSLIEFYNYFKEDHVWSYSNTKDYLQLQGCTDDMLYIVEKGGIEEKRLFISKLPNMGLISSISYKKDDREYRIIQMAVNAGLYDELRSKIQIDGKTLDSYAISDTVTYSINSTKYILSLSEMIPEYKQQYAWKAVFGYFKDIPGIELLFSLKEKSKRELRNEFSTYLKSHHIPLNATQMVYIALEKESNYSLDYWPDFVVFNGPHLVEAFDFCISQGWKDMLIKFIKLANKKFSFLIGHYYKIDTLAFPSEQVPDYIKAWMEGESDNTEKKSLLLGIGVKGKFSAEMLRRRAFCNDHSVNPDWRMTNDELRIFMHWIIYSQQLPLMQNEQREILFDIAKRNHDLFHLTLDMNRLASAKEWDTDYYKKWSCKTSKRIFFIDSKIPWILEYDNKPIILYEDKDIVSTSNYQFYLSSAVNPQTILSTLIGNNANFTQKDWDSLFLINRASLDTLQEENERLKKTIESIQCGERFERLDLSLSEQKEINQEARYRAKDYLLSHGYDCEEWNPMETNMIHSTMKNGKLISFVVASSRGGLIYLHPHKFAKIMEDPNNLLLVYDGNKVFSLSFEEAFIGNRDVNLIFDVDYINPQRMASIALQMESFRRSNFVIKNPNYSISDELKTFGLNERHNGTAPVGFSDDDI